MWYKGFFDDIPVSSLKPVNAKAFKTYDHRRHLAYSHKKAIIRAEIMSEVVNDINRTHKMPMNKERTFTFENDQEDEITEDVDQEQNWHIERRCQSIDTFANAQIPKPVRRIMREGENEAFQIQVWCVPK